uniref:HU family DNA-binding protein n=1 Tax=Prevotella sp. TaxID=59823 RepID=UPI004025ADFC
MSIYYRLYQNKIKNSKSFGKYYARTIHTDTVNLDNIADTIQRNCTLKCSDVKACLTELVEVMRDALQSSSKVRINGLGMFKINVKSTAASDPGTFKGNNIVGYRVIFSPEHTVIKAKGTTTADGKTTGTRVNSYYLFEGISAKRASKLDGQAAGDKTPTDSGQGSGSDGNSVNP